MVNHPGRPRAVALYLTWARPILLKHREFTIGTRAEGGDPLLLTGPLWIGEKGEALPIGAVELAIAKWTEMILGVALRPHEFRRCAAVTAGYRAGDVPNLASAFLQHRDRRVTDEHYNRTSSIRFGEMVS